MIPLAGLAGSCVEAWKGCMYAKFELILSVPLALNVIVKR